MVNSETLKLLRCFWGQYSTLDTNASKAFRAAVKKTYKEHHRGDGDGGFCSAAGPHAIHVQAADPNGDWAHDSKRYWETGAVDFPLVDRTSRPHSNPLFIYSQAGGNVLALQHQISPLPGFHLGLSLSTLTNDSPYYHEPFDGGPLNKAVETSKVQFQTWCSSFRRLIRASRGTHAKVLRIRFLISDPVSFCVALNQLKTGESGQIANRYSRSGAARPLVLNNQDYRADSKDPAPFSFDVVDASSLVDSMGFINLMPSVIPLLSNRSAVVYTNTIILASENEKHILSSMLCTPDINTMCALFGIVPTVYISGLTTRGYHQDNASAHHDSTVVFSRITWRFTTSSDPVVDLNYANPICSPKLFAKFLSSIFVRMLASRIQNANIPIYRPPSYTVASFALFLRFLQQRVNVSWDDTVKWLMEELTFYSGFLLMIYELRIYFHLFGVCELGLAAAIDPLPPALHDKSPVLARHPLPETIAIVVSIPRDTLDYICDKVSESGHPFCLRFWLHVSFGILVAHSFVCAQPIFGKLIATEDGEQCSIEEDIKGWHGSSDLHICTYFPTALLTKDFVDRAIFSIRLSPELKTRNTFEEDFGRDLEVYMAEFNNSNIRFFSSLPGLAIPLPDTSHGRNDKIAVRTTDVAIANPQLNFELKNFTTRIELAHGSGNHQSLKDRATVTITQNSPCTMTVRYSTFEHICNFPFPVAGKAPRLRVSRKEGWMEIIVPLVSPLTQRNTDSPLFPLHIADSSVSTWNLPYINFRQLPSLDLSDVNLPFWLQLHNLSMFTDRELGLRHEKRDLVTNFKNSIHAMLQPTTCLVSLKSESSTMYFFLSGMYLDLDSHSVVRMAHVLPATPESKQKNVKVQITLTEAEMAIWKSSLPAMAERCRDWEHTESCEYRKDFKIQGLELCSCGKGKFDGSFSFPDGWPDIKSHVTRIAISPVFCTPYLEPTRGLFSSSEGTRYLKNPASLEPIIDSSEFADIPKSTAEQVGRRCKICGKESAKKCGKCSRVSYCSKECQAQDWKTHKSVCVPFVV
jgi:hypothetical protein